MASRDHGGVNLLRVHPETIRHYVTLLIGHARYILEQESYLDAEIDQGVDDADELEEQLGLLPCEAPGVGPPAPGQVLARGASDHQPRLAGAVRRHHLFEGASVDLPHISQLRAPRELLGDEPLAVLLQLRAVVGQRLDPERSQGHAAPTDAVEESQKHECPGGERRWRFAGCCRRCLVAFHARCQGLEEAQASKKQVGYLAPRKAT
mmetsp:Transcript_29161/g.83585  ORF Transcript_29161/g.83585 Transcript_29161/m.83585 type:complete len:207 (-) Transcript_29161:3-623(-)